MQTAVCQTWRHARVTFASYCHVALNLLRFWHHLPASLSLSLSLSLSFFSVLPSSVTLAQITSNGFVSGIGLYRFMAMLSLILLPAYCGGFLRPFEIAVCWLCRVFDIGWGQLVVSGVVSLHCLGRLRRADYLVGRWMLSTQGSQKSPKMEKKKWKMQGK